MTNENDGAGGAKGGFFGITPGQIVQALAERLRSYAQDVGTACSMPGGRRGVGCDALTLGVRCETCARRVCMGHTFWNLSGAKPLPYCIYCAVELNRELFDEDDSE
jgi:hypothetical protein